MRFLPFTDLKNYQARYLRDDAFAAFSILFMSVPQGVAYAIIAGLPPVMGLYASTIPTIVGTLFRSSRHVITGPTNALSLLFGAAIARDLNTDPATTAITTAMIVGILQILAGVFRLGNLLSYVSRPFLLGYVTAAGLLIALGQLPSITGTEVQQGSVVDSFVAWVSALPGASALALSMSLGTIAIILILKKIKPALPGPAIAMTVATLICLTFNLQSLGLVTVQDLSPIPTGLPALTVPDLTLVVALFPISLALTTLSLLESGSIAQAISLESKQKIDNSVEFFGQGLANVSAAFFGGYPISGSLSRSKLNHTAGAQTRLSGVLEGVLMILVLLGLSDFINHTPLSALAGLLMVVAWNLIDRKRIQVLFGASLIDKLSFLLTLVAMLTVDLDIALYLSLAFVLLVGRIDYERFTILEYNLENDALISTPYPMEHRQQPALRVLEFQGKLFFGVANQIRRAVRTVGHQSSTRRLVILLNTSRSMDHSIAQVMLELVDELGRAKTELVIAGLDRQSERELKNAQLLSPNLDLRKLSETAPWSREKHLKLVVSQK